MSFLSDIILKSIALVGVEMQGMKFVDYVDIQENYMDNVYICCYNLSSEATEYILVMGVLILQIKWAMIAFNCLQIRIPLLVKQFLYLGVGLIYIILIIACIAEINISCPHT